MTDWALFGTAAVVIVYLAWARAVAKRWWRRSWGQFKAAVVWSPITIPLWLWRRLCLLFVPGWLLDRDFYQTPEWARKAVENKRAYGWQCAVCTVTQAELKAAGTALHSHHIKKRLTHPWLALTASNLAPLCPLHHRDVEAGRIKLRWDGKRWVVA